MPRAQRALLVFAAAAALVSCSPKAPADDSKYIETVTAARAAKDAALADAPSSPVPPDKRSALLPLPYFPIDPSYAVPAAFEEAPPGQRPQMDMPTSSGQPRRMERIGVLKFNLQGKPLQLGAFVEAGQPADRLFVPFADATTGTETYRAGRYLDIDRSPTGIYMIDFNTAFNPYCYYNPTYDCPYPPSENRLPLAIRAGEKVSAPK